MKGNDMKYIHYLVCFLFISCVEENNVVYEKQEVSKHQTEICHNPLSKNHNQICTEECFNPDREKYSFCWTLEKSDCVAPFECHWQQKVCHLFD
tara:strand:- start:4 stop:285 length:282 start_codon:yes stop_codon:yes gene_type:complete